ncbi:alpha/beta hydrolase [Nocardioides bruguierae]|uniref:alpha/beta hydrolase n=1 Tax=Nocardioides bruguierae TaxID=2945102 RepID=UPI0027E1D213|nr:alpha/beta fold hydrolase [Nocardioides bruguierae]
MFPRRETRVPVSVTDVALRVPGAVLRGWVTHPDAPAAVVYLGGNAEEVGAQRGVLSEELPGHAVHLMAYRGYGASSGRPSQRALVEDACAVVDEAARRYPAHPVVVIGRSLGSGVAVQVAARRALSALVMVTPFDSVAAVARDHAGRWGGLVADTFDSASLAPRVTAPVLVVRAGEDTVVRPARTDALLSALPPGTQVVDLPQADHANVLHAPGCWPAVRAFLGAEG